MIEAKDMYTVLSAMVPLYVAMLLAYTSVKQWKVFTPAQCSGINRFVATFAVPLLSFHFIATNDPYRMDGLFMLADTLAKAAVLAVLALWVHFGENGTLEWAITLFSVATLPNTLVMGIPLLSAMYGASYGGIMVQLVVLQCIVWYTLLLFLFECRAAYALVANRFPGTAIASFKVDADVLSLENGGSALGTEARVDDDGRVRVTIRRSASSCSQPFTSRRVSPIQRSMSSGGGGVLPPNTTRHSNLTGMDIYSVHSTRRSNATSTDIYSLHSSRTPTPPRPSDANEETSVFPQRSLPPLPLPITQTHPCSQTQGVMVNVGTNTGKISSHTQNSCPSDINEEISAFPQQSLPPLRLPNTQPHLGTQTQGINVGVDIETNIRKVTSHSPNPHPSNANDETFASPQGFLPPLPLPNTQSHLGNQMWGVSVSVGNNIRQVSSHTPISCPSNANDETSAFPQQSLPPFPLPNTLPHHRNQTRGVSVTAGVGTSIGKVSPKALRTSKRVAEPNASPIRAEDNLKELNMFLWSSATSPTSDATMNTFGGGNASDCSKIASEPNEVQTHVSPSREDGITPNKEISEPSPASYTEEECSFCNRSKFPADTGSPIEKSQQCMPKLSSVLHSPKEARSSSSGIRGKPPPTVMMKLIFRMVGRKLLHNPNTYSSLLGLSWALIAFRWNISMPIILSNSIKILSDAGLGMAMFSLGLFMALQPRLIACGTQLASFTMVVRFLTGPAIMAATSIVVGLRGVDLHAAIVQAALPQGIVPFVFAREYDLHPDILSTAVIFGMLVSLPITLLYYILLGLQF